MNQHKSQFLVDHTIFKQSVFLSFFLSWYEGNNCNWNTKHYSHKPDNYLLVHTFMISNFVKCLYLMQLPDTSTTCLFLAILHIHVLSTSSALCAPLGFLLIAMKISISMVTFKIFCFTENTYKYTLQQVYLCLQVFLLLKYVCKIKFLD